MYEYSSTQLIIANTCIRCLGLRILLITDVAVRRETFTNSYIDGDTWYK